MTRHLPGLLALLALPLAMLACTNQRLEPHASYVAAAQQQPVMSTGSPNGGANNGTANGAGTQGSPDSFRENFRDAQNVVKAFLLAAQDEDAERLRRTLTADANLHAIIAGGQEGDSLPLLPAVPAPSDVRRDAVIGLLVSEPWRWSALRCRIWRYAGVGPVVTIAEDLVRVSLVPHPGTDYHLRFQLVLSAADGTWSINRVAANYDAEDVQGFHADFVESKVKESGVPEGLDDPLAVAKRLLDRSARDAMANELEVWQAMMPESVRDLVTNQTFSDHRNKLMGRLLEYAAQSDARVVGAYIERAFSPAADGADSTVCVVRVLVKTDADDETLPQWSVRVQLRSFVKSWKITALDAIANRAAWPSHASQQAAAGGGN